jgi:hypothetical protein
MSCTVLYIEEKMSDKKEDWRVCIRYGGGDTYLLYGNRWNGNSSNFRMEFLSRESVFKFLSLVICQESTLDITLYNVNYSDINKENFSSYYESYDTNNELVGYDNLTFKEFNSDLMNCLQVLRDSRCY